MLLLMVERSRVMASKRTRGGAGCTGKRSGVQVCAVVCWWHDECIRSPSPYLTYARPNSEDRIPSSDSYD